MASQEKLNALTALLQEVLQEGQEINSAEFVQTRKPVDAEKNPIDVVFKAKPSLIRCNECFIRDNCSSRVEMPHIDEIVY